MESNDKIYIAGHRGMVGSAMLRKLTSEGYTNIVTRTSSDLDLRNQKAVRAFFKQEKPDYVILAAAKVGGIQANMNKPAEFLYDNLQIQNNVINEAYINKVKKLVFLGSSCIYPKNSPQPMKEEYILTGRLEPTNEGYAIAKIAGLKLCEFYRKQFGFNCISVMPCNLYGPNDSFDLLHSHVLSALVKRFCDAKSLNKKDVTLWGSGMARREFMHVDDLTRALLLLIDKYEESEIINVGWGVDVSIKELAELIAFKTGFNGEVKWDLTKSDGMLKKCMDITKIKSMGFTPQIQLSEGIDQMIEIYKSTKI
jgi:GDP-L-fucose synthase